MSLIKAPAVYTYIYTAATDIQKRANLRPALHCDIPVCFRRLIIRGLDGLLLDVTLGTTWDKSKGPYYPFNPNLPRLYVLSNLAYLSGIPGRQTSLSRAPEIHHHLSDRRTDRSLYIFFY